VSGGGDSKVSQAHTLDEAAAVDGDHVDPIAAVPVELVARAMGQGRFHCTRSKHTKTKGVGHEPALLALQRSSASARLAEWRLNHLVEHLTDRSSRSQTSPAQL